MNYNAVYFSPTGGTQRVVEIILGGLSSYTTIDLCKRENFSKYCFGGEDVVYAAVPVYGGRVPKVALNRLRQMEGGGAKTVIIAVYGERAFEDALLELKRELTDRGFFIIAAVAAVSKHSIAPTIGADRPNSEDIVKLKGFGNIIAERLIEPKELDYVPGGYPYRNYNDSAFKFSIGENCSGCGICAEGCPVGAIDAANVKIVDDKLCMGCMRCFSICPIGARAADKDIINAITQRLKPLCTPPKEPQLFI